MQEDHPEKRHRVLKILCVFFASFILVANAAGADAAKDANKAEGKVDKTCSDASGLAEILPADHLVVTEHKLHAADLDLSYRASAGTLPIKLDKDGPECHIFFIGYQAHNKGKAKRPLTFVFNGGPGASSAYLHLGVLGPTRVLLNADGSMPAPPARLADNLETWLRFTDLVFVDPAGTGYSRCEQSKGDKARTGADARAWGVKEDLTSLAKFIRLYLTRNNRWLSPKYLVGESYGGFRVAALADLLQTDYDIALNGVVLVSPALEFELIWGNEFSLLPWVVRLPSYAATARFHGKAAGQLANEGDLRDPLKEVEFFAIDEYLPALAASDTSSIQTRLAGFIGLPVRRVARLNGRISPRQFSKELLQDTGRLISIYDGSVTAIDPDPASPFPPNEDPLLVQFSTLLASAFNSYVREQLKFETDIPYEILNVKVANRWNWRSGLDASQGFAGVAENLKKSMSINKSLKVFIAHGLFDLVTPYFGSVLVTRQMALDPAVAPHLSLKIYRGGHMFYTNDTARKRFFKDGEQFFASPEVPAGQ